MKKFKTSITGKSGNPIVRMECGEVFATFDQANGLRIIGTDPGDRNYTIDINSDLAIEIARLVANNTARAADALEAAQ
jgi:hypothetical protein